jgi:chemotaxis protein methyltransferase CheR
MTGHGDRVAAAAAALQARLGLRLDGPARGRLAVAAAGTEDDRVDAVTVQESRFFRDPGHFALLRRRVLADPAPDVIWSAGCGNGEEPWSLAMLLAEAGLDGWRVLATDVSRAARDRTLAGRYGERELRGLSAARRARFLEPDGDGWRIVDSLRERVAVRPHHLLDPPPREAGACRHVLWRNVLIYLLPEAAERALRGLRARMPDDGLLLLGAGEALPPGAGGFRPVRHGAVFAYAPGPPAPRRAPAADPPPGAVAEPGPATDRADPAATRRNLALARERLLRRD